MIIKKSWQKCEEQEKQEKILQQKKEEKIAKLNYELDYWTENEVHYKEKWKGIK